MTSDEFVFPDPQTFDPPPGPVASVMDLIVRAKAGDERARDLLFEQAYPTLKRLAHGRLPGRARTDKDTDDVVQITLMRALRSIDGFEPRWEGAWLAYLRQILFNYLKDEARRTHRLPDQFALLDDDAVLSISPLDSLIDAEIVEAYGKSLGQLSQSQRDAVVMRVELGLGYGQIGELVGSPSPDATRMMVKRALARLAELVHGSAEKRGSSNQPAASIKTRLSGAAGPDNEGRTAGS